ncbi:MAG: DHH family phosphoesterase, partial [Peptococcaceae bacterium]|nr:DHH family phosphoesterase [Peptococcaceae bacterium]
KIGLEQLSASQRPGLLALKQQCGAKESLTADDVSFQMAPRLNAAGRVAQADNALKLLMTDYMEEAWEIAGDLDVSNTVRQEIGNNIFAEALGIVHGQPELANANILVLASPQWHQGVLGIVAARFSERFYRPVLLIALDGDTGKGSARSIPGLNIYNALHHCRDYLVRYGGHDQAAGITIQKEQIAKFTMALDSYAGEEKDQIISAPGIDIDALVQINNISEELVNEIDRLRPFGRNNPPPLLACRGAKILNCRGVGKEAAHLKMQLHANERPIDSIGFRFGALAEPLAQTKSVDLAFVPGFNEYNGQRHLQLEIKDVGLPASVITPEPIWSNGVAISKEKLSYWPEFINDLLYGRRYPVNPMGETLQEIIDGRKWIDRLEKLADLAADREQTLVITGNDAFTTQIVYYLWFSCPSIKERIYCLYNSADPRMISECAARFANNELGLVVTTPGMAAAMQVKARRMITFYPPCNKDIMDELLSFAYPEGKVYLCYNEEEQQEIYDCLVALVPDRDLLAGYYTLLRRLSGGKRQILVTPEKTACLLETNLNRQVRDYTIHAATLILAELDLIKADRTGRTISVILLPAPSQKKDLLTSPMYQKLHETKNETEKFINKIFAKVII